MTVLETAERLRDAVRGYPERAPAGAIAYILDPLEYAWGNHAAYITRFAPAGHRVEAIFLGMNPGPWGMAQTGIPFGSPDMVRGFLDIHGEVKQPKRFHPKRPILGVHCPKNEVSGQRLWGAIRDCFGTPEKFFARFYVLNYCPLAFQSESGANLTPDKLPASLWADCARASALQLVDVVRALKPKTVIGVGKWATIEAQTALSDAGLSVATATILHPSPANPAANRGWKQTVLGQLEMIGHPWK